MYWLHTLAFALNSRRSSWLTRHVETYVSSVSFSSCRICEDVLVWKILLGVPAAVLPLYGCVKTEDFLRVFFLVLLTATYVAGRCKLSALLLSHYNSVYGNVPHHYVIRTFRVLLTFWHRSFTFKFLHTLYVKCE
jgi:hypothetical protein